MNMIRNALTALLLSTTGPVSAVHLDPDGRGQVLIFPYYSTAGDTQTLLSVVNHRDSGKAVKLRVREARNGREVATLNLYLGEFDVWTAALFTAPDGTPALLTDDHSCTVPAVDTSSSLPRLPDGRPYLPFSNAEFIGPRSDGGPTELSRLATGYIEVIEMGSLIDHSNSDRYATPVNGVPFSCQSLVAAWSAEQAGYWRADPTTDLSPPLGGLSGSLSLLRVGEGTAWEIPVSAIDAFSVIMQHTAPDSRTPDLASAVTEPAQTSVESNVLAAGRLVRSRWPQSRAIDAVSAVLSQETIRAEYTEETTIGARTDWVLSMPTRRFYNDPAITAIALVPFTVLSDQPQRCEVVRPTSYNREGARPVGAIGFGGVIEPGTCICDAVQLLPVGGVADPAAPAAALCQRNPLPTVHPGAHLDAGFYELQMAGGGRRTRPALDGETYEGLPILGFTLQSYRNAAARPGEIGIYSSARRQSGDVRCRRGSADCAPLPFD